MFGLDAFARYLSFTFSTIVSICSVFAVRLVVTLITFQAKMSGEMRVAKLIRYLTILTVSLVKAEHGGDEFKNWPVKPGPWVQATRGEVWPKPKVSKPQQEFFVLRSNSFRFEVRD